MLRLTMLNLDITMLNCTILHFSMLCSAVFGYNYAMLYFAPFNYAVLY